MVRVLLLVIPVVITVYALIDAIMADRRRVTVLPRSIWALVIIALPVIGAVLWFAVGRPRGTGRNASPRVVGPDDDPGFLAQIRRPKPR